MQTIHLVEALKRFDAKLRYHRREQRTIEFAVSLIEKELRRRADEAQREVGK